jgi:hypothetical protein
VTSFCNVCPKVGIGDERQFFEEVFGKATSGPFLFDEIYQDLIEYSQADASASFYKNIVYQMTLNESAKLLTESEMETIIKAHIPKDSEERVQWKWNIGGKPFQTKEYYSRIVSDLFYFTDNNPKLSNISVAVTRDLKNEGYTTINISVLESKPSKEELDKKREEFRNKIEMEERRNAEIEKELQAEKAKYEAEKHEYKEDELSKWIREGKITNDSDSAASANQSPAPQTDAK